ncbi:hypothetical protein MNBD_GAMMA13-928 [hydrothermal vent metagenome]|uniref:Uncharacterized protein n=1 Tax=hydrothermal vent metagenome TaxID=652676 RepID=A0A3B0YVI4_9ZZZZ
MVDELERTGARFSLLLFSGFLLIPVAGYAAAILFDILSINQFQQILAAGIVPAFSVFLVFLSLLQMQRLIMPLTTWAIQHPQGGNAPSHLQRQFQRFNFQFWSLLAVHTLLSPFLVFWSLDGSISSENHLAVAHFMLLQLFTTMLVGVPAFLFGLQQLGKFAGHLGLERVHVSLKTRTLLLAGLVPVLSYSLLIYYHWLQTGRLDKGYLIIWAALATITATISLLSISSSRQALAPFQRLLSRSGASTHKELSRLRPASTDEIGHLTQTLGKVFQRLGDQETHMRAIVDTAAEGIIVVDEAGLINTFNPAAERLFGYPAQEIRGRHLISLLPGIFVVKQQIDEHREERDIEGTHRDGSLFQCSLRVSAMVISGKRMFTCLVADISQRKLAESELLETESRYRALVETAHDLVWSMDSEGCWSHLNSATLMIYGLQPEDMLGRPAIEFCAPDNLEADRKALQTLMAGEDLYQYETTHLDRQGNRHQLSFNAKIQRGADGCIHRISGTARDISDRKALRQRLAHQAEHDYDSANGSKANSYIGKPRETLTNITRLIR